MQNGKESTEELPILELNTTSVQDSKRSMTTDEAMEEIGFGKFQVMIMCLSGGVWMADSMEIMILSILGKAIFKTPQSILSINP